jgi:hypothetical protein
MKIVKLIAVLAMMFSVYTAHATCIGQETTVMFINGVWTPNFEAEQHSKALERESRKAGISESCVHFDYSHTQDDGRTSDIVESLIQRSLELHVDLLPLVRGFFWLTVWDAETSAALDHALATAYGTELSVIESQAEKHLLKFKGLTHIDDPDLTKRQRGIAVTHSQGGLYGNTLWNLLTPEQQVNTRLVSVVTPSDHVEGGGPNTRLSRDGVANKYFLFALAVGKIPNTGLCDTEAVEDSNSWPCHGFETGYLHDVEARAQIVGDIKEVLPHATILGTVRDFTGGSSFVSGATVSLFSDTTLITETHADNQGRYRFDNIPAPCPACFVKAKSVQIDVCGTTSTPVVPEDIRTADITLSGSCDVMPPVTDTTDFSNLLYGTGTLTGNSFVANIPVGTNLVFVGLAYVNADGDFPKPSAPWYRFGTDDACDIPGTITNGVYSHTLSSNMNGLCSGRNPTYFYDVLGYQVGNIRYVTAVYKFHNAGTISAPVWELVSL